MIIHSSDKKETLQKHVCTNFSDFRPDGSLGSGGLLADRVSAGQLGGHGV